MDYYGNAGAVTVNNRSLQLMPYPKAFSLSLSGTNLIGLVLIYFNLA